MDMMYWADPTNGEIGACPTDGSPWPLHLMPNASALTVAYSFYSRLTATPQPYRPAVLREAMRLEQEAIAAQSACERPTRASANARLYLESLSPGRDPHLARDLANDALSRYLGMNPEKDEIANRITGEFVDC